MIAGIIEGPSHYDIMFGPLTKYLIKQHGKIIGRITDSFHDLEHRVGLETISGQKIRIDMRELTLPNFLRRLYEKNKGYKSLDYIPVT